MWNKIAIRLSSTLSYIFFLFAYSTSSAVVDPQSGQTLWCLTTAIAAAQELISSKMSVVESKVEQVDCSPQPPVCDTSLLTSKIDLVQACAPTPLNGPGGATIMLPGSYCVLSDMAGIIIASSNVTINLNGHTVGSINMAAISFVTITNGTTGALALGIGTSDVRLSNLIMGTFDYNDIRGLWVKNCVIQGDIENNIIVGGARNVLFETVITRGTIINMGGITNAVLNQCTMDSFDQMDISANKGMMLKKSLVEFLPNGSLDVIGCESFPANLVVRDMVFSNRSSVTVAIIRVLNAAVPNAPPGAVQMTRCALRNVFVGLSGQSSVGPGGALSGIITDVVTNKGISCFGTSTTVPYRSVYALVGCCVMQNALGVNATQPSLVRFCTVQNGNGFTGSSGARLFNNIACNNTPANYNPTVSAVNPISSPANARGVVNVDCSLTTADAAETTESKMVVIDSKTDSLDSKVDALLMNHP